MPSDKVRKQPKKVRFAEELEQFIDFDDPQECEDDQSEDSLQLENEDEKTRIIAGICERVADLSVGASPDSSGNGNPSENQSGGTEDVIRQLKEENAKLKEQLRRLSEKSTGEKKQLENALLVAKLKEQLRRLSEKLAREKKQLEDALLANESATSSSYVESMDKMPRNVSDHSRHPPIVPTQSLNIAGNYGLHAVNKKMDTHREESRESSAIMQAKISDVADVQKIARLQEERLKQSIPRMYTDKMPRNVSDHSRHPPIVPTQSLNIAGNYGLHAVNKKMDTHREESRESSAIMQAKISDVADVQKIARLQEERLKQSIPRHSKIQSLPAVQRMKQINSFGSSSALQCQNLDPDFESRKAPEERHFKMALKKSIVEKQSFKINSLLERNNFTCSGAAEYQKAVFQAWCQVKNEQKMKEREEKHSLTNKNNNESATSSSYVESMDPDFESRKGPEERHFKMALKKSIVEKQSFKINSLLERNNFTCSGAAEYQKAVFQAWCQVKNEQKMKEREEKHSLTNKNNEKDEKRDSDSAYMQWKKSKRVERRKNMPSIIDPDSRTDAPNIKDKGESEAVFKMWKEKKDAILMRRKSEEIRLEQEQNLNSLMCAEQRKKEADLAFAAWKHHKDEVLKKEKQKQAWMQLKEKEKDLIQHKRNEEAQNVYLEWLEKKTYAIYEETFAEDSKQKAPWYPP